MPPGTKSPGRMLSERPPFGQKLFGQTLATNTIVAL